MQKIFDTLLLYFLTIFGYFGEVTLYSVFHDKSKPMDSTGCLFEGRIIPDGKSVAIKGSCQILKCYGNKFQKSNEECATITSRTFKCFPGESHIDQKTCIMSSCFVDRKGYSMTHTKGCKINGKCVFPSDFKDTFGLRFLCHHMRCTGKGIIKSQRKSLCSEGDLCRSTRWIDAYKCMD
ncbi:uncharacterized protein LOC134264762 [Saccostrea cucullata]|uniref:uncharacterized protein LOC134264762 n=1 Tax=Saccostrea cuccullata TaxID=36930 RepID=UPI002ED0B04E